MDHHLLVVLVVGVPRMLGLRKCACVHELIFQGSNLLTFRLSFLDLLLLDVAFLCPNFSLDFVLLVSGAVLSLFPSSVFSVLFGLVDLSLEGSLLIAGLQEWQSMQQQLR